MTQEEKHTEHETGGLKNRERLLCASSPLFSTGFRPRF